MATITEDYVSFETAKLLREKGFKEPTLAYAYGNDMVAYYSQPRVTDDFKVEAGRYPLPTLQMAMKWLRIKHNLYVTPVLASSGKYGRWEADIYYCDGEYSGINATRNACEHIFGETPEETCETALKYCLENLI